VQANGYRGVFAALVQQAHDDCAWYSGYFKFEQARRTENHPDPFLKRTQARAAAERDEQTRRVLTAQIRADRDAARARWAPALDPRMAPPGRPSPDLPGLGCCDAVRRSRGSVV
jgi:hypothetical protein